MRKRRVEITVETQQILILRRTGTTARRWCGGCLEDALMVTPDEAAAACVVSTRSIYRWVEAGHLHFREGKAEPMLICLNSLIDLTARR